MSQRKQIKSSKGFTLLEVILAIVVAAILGAMLVQFMGTGVMQSVNPIFMVQNGSYLNSIMENIGADYRRLMTTSSSPLTDLNQRLTTNPSLYGAGFDVVTKRFDFPSGAGNVTEPAAASASGKVLKVTVTYNGMSLTSLFTE
ncbi:MAG TPA: type II secretion system protein [Smithella sp.]|nr:type II secretion system protein [Smithella sp.]